MRFIDQNHVGVRNTTKVESINGKAFLRDNLSRNGSRPKLVFPHWFQGSRTDNQRLLSHMIGVVFQQLLAYPRLTDPDRLGDDDSVILSQDAPRLANRICLKLRQ